MNDFLKDNLDEQFSADGGVDSAWGKVRDCTFDAMALFIPSRQVRDGRNLPWITPRVQRLLRRRNRARKKARRGDSEEGWARFRALRNRAVAILRRAKQS